ncbi:MAG: hypothetical protein ACE5Q6_02305, partial [Dehalococcoidia bacterium]
DSIGMKEEVMTTHYLVSDTSATGWEQSIYAFLAEKERRSGSRRTVETYSRMLYQFFGTLAKPPDQVTATEVFSFGHGVGLSGKSPGSVTIGARIACISSFYRFLIRMTLLDESLAISTELGMRPLMERVLSRRHILKA